MSKNLKLGIIATAVILICGIGGGTYYRIDQLNQKQAYFDSQFTKAQNLLPKAIKLTKITDSSLFETVSTVTIQPNIDGVKNDSKLVIKTHLNHGLSYLLTGEITGSSIGKLSGNITNGFKGLDKLFESTISISEDDNFTSDTKFTDIVAKDDSQIKGITSHFETHKADSTMRANFKIADMLSPKVQGQVQPLFQASGFAVSYSGKIDDIGNNHFEISLNDIHSVVAQVKGFNLSSDSIIKGANADIKANFKINKIDVGNWKDGSVNFSYSMKNIDVKSLQTIVSEIKKSSKTSPEEFSKLNSVLQEQGKNILTHGLEFNIDKLAFKSGTNSFDGSLNIVLPKSDSFDNVNIEKTLKLHEKLVAKGEVATVLQQQLITQSKVLGISPETISDEFNFEFNIDSGKATFNKQELTTEQNDNLHIVLSSFDDVLHGKVPQTDDSKPVPIKK